MPRTPFASGHVQNMWDQKFWSCITGTVASFKLSDAKIFMYTHTNQISKSSNASFMHAQTQWYQDTPPCQESCRKKAKIMLKFLLAAYNQSSNGPYACIIDADWWGPKN